MRMAMRWVVAAGVLLGGCSCSDKRASVAPLSEQERATLPTVSPEQLQSLLDAEKGKVIVLVVWSVRRPACTAMFPKLGGLAAQGATIVAINIDRVDDVRKKVLPLLDQHRPTFTNRVLAAGPEALAPFVGTDWSGQVPALVVRDRAGQRVATYYGEGALEKAAKQVRVLAQQ